jgi:hypothetical protein
LGKAWRIIRKARRRKMRLNKMTTRISNPAGQDF